MGILEFFKKTSEQNYFASKNENLRAISMRFRNSKEDTVFVTTSRVCPVCSMYNRRIYSLYGRYKKFPLLPDFLKNDICPTCGVHIGYSHYFPGINGNLRKDIEFSNRPFVDSRTSEERQFWSDTVAKKQCNVKLENDFAWICKNIPDMAPKSIGGYKRMAKSNSKNYQKICVAAKEKGYII